MELEQLAGRQRTYWTSTSERIRRIWSLDAPLRERLGLLRIVVARKLGQKTISWRSGPAGICLSADDVDVDWRTVLGIFVDGDYRTRYVGATVLDLGGHKGFFGAYALARGASTVTSYEPSSANFAALATATASVDGGRWRAVHAAVAAEAGERILELSDRSWANKLAPSDAPAPEVARTERVRAVTLSQALEEVDAPARLILKIDVEGAECEIIPATSPADLQRVDELFVELEGNCTIESLSQHLAAAQLQLVGRTAPSVYRFAR